MVSHIETLVIPLTLNKSALTDDKKLSCIGTIQIWFFVHTIVTICTQAYFCLSILIPIFSFVAFFTRFSWYRWSYAHNDTSWIIEYEHQERYSNIIRLLKQEAIFIFVYVIAAIFYVQLGLVNINYTITYVVLIRWLIEATSVSFIIFFCITFGYYVEWIEDPIDEFPWSYVLTLFIKVPLFITMRYAESKSDFFLHDFESLLFYALCYVSEYKMPIINVSDIRANHSSIY
jgi:hypothetical protein